MQQEKIMIWSLEVSYKKFQKKGNNDTILILHWWWWNSTSWLKVGEILSENWFDVIALDYPGFWDTKIDKIYDIEAYAVFVKEFVKAIKLEKFILMWHSNWWRISIKLVNKWNLKIKKLILNNAAWIKHPLTKKQRFFWILAKVFKIFKKIPWVNQIRKIFYRAIWWHDYLALNNEFLKQTFLNMISSDQKDEISKIDLETLLIRWEKDTYTPLIDGKTMNNLIKWSKLIVLNWEKHGIHLQNPERLAKAILENL